MKKPTPTDAATPDPREVHLKGCIEQRETLDWGKDLSPKVAGTLISKELLEAHEVVAFSTRRYLENPCGVLLGELQAAYSRLAKLKEENK